MADIIKYKRVIRGFLGVSIGDLDRLDKETKAGLKLPTMEGVYVHEVTPDTPADEAGLSAGDVIVSFDGKKTLRMRALRRMVAEFPVGKTTQVTVIRDGKELTFDVTIAEQPDTNLPAGSWVDRELGITVQNLHPSVARRLEVEGEMGVYVGEQGVLVVEVDAKGRAARAGVRRYDLIREVSNKKVTGVVDYRRIRRETKVEEGVLLFVKHGRKATLITVK